MRAIARLFQPPSLSAAHSNAAPIFCRTAQTPRPNCQRFLSPVIMDWPICRAICSSRPEVSSRLKVSSRNCSLDFRNSNTPDWATIRRNLNHMSAMLVTMPLQVRANLSLAPAARSPISSINFAMASRPSFPLLASFWMTGTGFPMAFESRSHTGTPRSISCNASSPCSFPLVHACPTARMIPCKCSAPLPLMAMVSTRACMVPFVGSSPNVRSCAYASMTWCNSSGVRLANFRIHCMEALALAADPSSASSCTM